MAWARMLRWGTRFGVVLAVALPPGALVAALVWPDAIAFAALYEMLLLAGLAARWAAARPAPRPRRVLAAGAAAMLVVGLFVAVQVPLARHNTGYATNALIGVSLEVVMAQALLYSSAVFLLARGLKRTA
ncbi:MAG TPA: hypothetical protein VN606_11155 [Thermoleophilaceae bacterium]|nr:hypothetical protein [Thermoleophilaceae bacterium]